jgi:AraC family transcriptional regulator
MRAMRSLPASDAQPDVKRALLVSPLVAVHEITCLRAQRGLSCEECKTEHALGLTLSGVNVRHVEGRAFTASASHVMLSNRGQPYRVSHPFGSGEVQLNFAPRDDLLIELLAARDPTVQDRHERPFRAHQLPAGPQLRLAAQLFAAAAASGRADRVQLEEAAIALLGHMVSSLAPATPTAPASPRDHELVQRSRAALVGLYAKPIGLQDIAASAGVSVYHLCRVFRRVTGTTLWAELLALRVDAALAQLTQGERDLTTIGLSAGFADHSHFANAFRRRLGVTPSHARRLLRHGALSDVRKLLARPTTARS